MNIKFDIETLYESTSSNRNENNISSKDQYILYSRSRCPVIWNLETKVISASLFGHNGDINGQHFIHDLEDTEGQSQYLTIISTAYDKSAIIWQLDRQNVSTYQILHKFSSPDDNVFLTRSCVKLGNDFYSITTTVDGNIFFWENSNLKQTLQVKYCCLTSKLFFVAHDSQADFIFLALSGSDNNVHIYQISPKSDEQQFMLHLFDLSGFNDWVKCIDDITLTGRQNELLLATASQDSLVRIWHLKLVIASQTDPGNIRTALSKHVQTSAGIFQLSATLETVISGHSGFVLGLCWVKRQSDSTRLQIFSCSADKTIALWESSINPSAEKFDSTKYVQCPASQGVWTEAQRLGETGETNLPFIGICLAGKDEKILVAQSLRGALHTWIRTVNDDRKENKHDEWNSSESITGHYDSITDLSWEQSGSYLLSSSLDKTCRLHALSSLDTRWHELARPQVHGHEINCVSSLNFCKFASGAEEKTIRTFGATQFFLKNYKQLADCVGIDLDMLINVDQSEFQLPVHAQLPALGLSNRGASSPYDIGDGRGDSIDTKDAVSALPASQDGTWNEISDLVKQLAKVDCLNDLPCEEILLQSMLWWETNKTFGHSNELHALASDSLGKFLASASKANRVDLAKVFIWETEKFRRVATIEHHSLTITRLRFSPDDKYLLSVSRDRTWCLCERTGQIRNAYRQISGTNKSNAVHERIIWDCCWTYDSKHFITVSRDKRAILWNVDYVRSTGMISESKDQEAAQIPPNARAINYVTSKLFDCSIQAVDSPMVPIRGVDGKSSYPVYLFAFGFENGSLGLYSLCIDSTATSQYQWNCLGSFANFHQLSIRRLAFRPNPRSEQQEESSKLLLASGADDCVLKLTKFVMAN